jgi:hypothetical protein
MLNAKYIQLTLTLTLSLGERGLCSLSMRERTGERAKKS